MLENRKREIVDILAEIQDHLEFLGSTEMLSGSNLMPVDDMTAAGNLNLKHQNSNRTTVNPSLNIEPHNYISYASEEYQYHTCVLANVSQPDRLPAQPYRSLGQPDLPPAKPYRTLAQPYRPTAQTYRPPTKTELLPAQPACPPAQPAPPHPMGLEKTLEAAVNYLNHQKIKGTLLKTPEREYSRLFRAGYLSCVQHTLDYLDQPDINLEDHQVQQVTSALSKF